MLHFWAVKKIRIVIIILVFLVILVATGFFLIGYFSPKPGGIRIETTPVASVFINGELVGKTPYQGSHKAGKMILRLVPEGSAEYLVPFESSITLVSGIETAVGRTFGTTEGKSSGYIISFEKTKARVASMAVVTQPSDAQVLIDGVSRGFSPYNVSPISPAMHAVTTKYLGYSDFSMTVKTLAGYRLTFYAKLGEGESEDSSPLEELESEGGKVVKILDTPTGYLRVRTKPGGSGEEIAQVAPGDTFPYLNTDPETGWIEVQYQAAKAGMPSGITGWVSGEYATVIEE